MDKAINASLYALPCFKTIKTITPMSVGLSSKCYVVHADNRSFFAKQITNTDEIVLSCEASINHLSPTVIYHDDDWLITAYIDSDNLSHCSNSLDKRIVIALKLMGQCHQLTVDINYLEPQKLVDELLSRQPLEAKLTQELFHVTQPLINKLNVENNIVCCHGDLNFTNVLIDRNNTPWLIDFECTCKAPAEFDLAMFIAVNNLSSEDILNIIEQYQEYSPLKINKSSLHDFLQYCHLINALWYSQAFIESQNPTLKQLAKQQWQNLPLNEQMKSEINDMISLAQRTYCKGE